MMEAAISRSVGIIPESKGYIHDGTNEEVINFLCRHHMQRLKSPHLIIYHTSLVFLNPVLRDSYYSNWDKQEYS